MLWSLMYQRHAVMIPCLYLGIGAWLEMYYTNACNYRKEIRNATDHNKKSTYNFLSKN